MNPYRGQQWTTTINTEVLRATCPPLRINKDGIVTWPSLAWKWHCCYSGNQWVPQWVPYIAVSYSDDPERTPDTPPALGLLWKHMRLRLAGHTNPLLWACTVVILSVRGQAFYPYRPGLWSWNKWLVTYVLYCTSWHVSRHWWYRCTGVMTMSSSGGGVSASSERLHHTAWSLL